jgi:hypothetical protein
MQKRAVFFINIKNVHDLAVTKSESKDDDPRAGESELYWTPQCAFLCVL